jgi:hypothetical protein
VHLANSFPAARGYTIMGTKGTIIDERNRLIVYPEPVDHGVQAYGTLQWPKAKRAEYFASKGWRADGRPRTPPGKARDPEEIEVERGPSHAGHFILSIRDNKPSRETAQEGHLAAGAAHVANMAYRQGRRLKWDWRRNVVSEG